MDKNIYETLEIIKEEINQEFGFQDGLPRINYGPCGVFAHVFYKKWNALFKKKVRICFLFAKSKIECNHVLIRLPSGELYDGGLGVHRDEHYNGDYVLAEMKGYDEALLNKWSYGLKRNYDFCPEFKRQNVEKIVHQHLEDLSRKKLNKRLN